MNGNDFVVFEPQTLVLMLRNSKFHYTPPQETRFFVLLIALALSTSGTRTRSMHFEYEYDGKPNCATPKLAPAAQKSERLTAYHPNEPCVFAWYHFLFELVDALPLGRVNHVVHIAGGIFAEGQNGYPFFNDLFIAGCGIRRWVVT